MDFIQITVNLEFNMAGRPRTPTSVLKAKGSFVDNPGRGRARENEPKNLKPFTREVPSHLDEDERICYLEIAEECPKGVLTASDRKHLELAAILYAQVKIHKGNLRTDKLALYMRTLGYLGMNPSERSKVQVAKIDDNKNRFLSED